MNKLNFLLFLIGSFLATVCVNKAQTPCDSDDQINSLVLGLNNSSFETTSTYFPEIIIKGESSGKLMNKGKKAACDLFLALNDIEKIIPSHLILTKIFYPESFNLKTAYQYDYDQVIGAIYTVNGLSWNWSEEKGISIEKPESDSIIEFWRKELEY